MSLLAKAKKIKTQTPDKLTEEHIELALAWAHDEVTLKQVSDALGDKDSKTYITLARSFRKYFREQK